MGTQAGYGKMFLKNKSDFDDLKSVIMMSKDYYTYVAITTLMRPVVTMSIAQR